MNQTKAALRMFLVRGLGLRSANNLIRHFKHPEAVLEANRDELEAQGIPPEIADDLLSSKSAQRAEQEWAKAEELGVKIVDILDPVYPPLLREIFDPPIVLYLRGKKWEPDLPQVAIVGTRRPTGYGINCAERLAEDLAARGLAVTSGLARGLDAAAHRGALRAGVTYAVFGSGLDFVYPKENRKLADLVEENGAVISEFPLGTPPSPQNFPIRNRIIAGMSLGVAVVEAAEYSGSLITVRLALESGREIFAVPGNITSPNSFGPHVLIRQGAKLVSNWQDVVEELPHPIRERIFAPLVAQMQAAPEPKLDGAEAKVWKLLSLQEAISIDTLLAKLPMSTSEVYSALLALEISEYVRQLPGKKYIRRL
ncbi:MAG: DNA-protecting protein DprA [Acidobacteria bacterium]|nr:MAG: DNA-protecting protein DprA [Acidobacteriota bacterium]